MDEGTNNQEIIQPKTSLVKAKKSNAFLDALFSTRFKVSVEEDIAGIQFSKDGMSLTFTIKNPNFEPVNDIKDG